MTLVENETDDSLDPMAYAHRTLDPAKVLAELGFKHGGTDTNDLDFWIKKLDERIILSVLVDNQTGLVSYRKVRLTNPKKPEGTFQVMDSAFEIPVHELRKLMAQKTEAQEVIHRLLDNDPDAFDPRADLERLVPHKCPECGSSNISDEADDEGLLDCFNCGIWFNPLHPNNAPGVPGNFPDPNTVQIIDYPIDAQGNRRPPGWQPQQENTEDPDDPIEFMRSLPPHPEAAGMIQSNKNAAYWTYSFVTWEGSNSKLAVSHSRQKHEDGTPWPFGTYTISLDVGTRIGIVTPPWNIEAGIPFLALELRVREAVDQFIQAVRSKRPTGDAVEALWERLFTQFKQQQESLEDKIQDYALRHGEAEDPDDPIAFIRSLPQPQPRIAISYSQTTPESAAQGDSSANGWVNEEGVEMTPDAFDYEEGISTVDLAVKFLDREGASQASSSAFYPGVWYSTDYSTIDYRTGTDEERCFHLKDFSDEEQRQIWNKLHQRWRKERLA